MVIRLSPIVRRFGWLPVLIFVTAVVFPTPVACRNRGAEPGIRAVADGISAWVALCNQTVSLRTAPPDSASRDFQARQMGNHAIFPRPLPGHPAPPEQETAARCRRCPLVGTVELRI